MAGPVRTEAVVLRGMKYGEADRILHVFTPELGRRSVIARGARKPRSKLGGRLEPPSHVELELHEGRGDIATVTGATTLAALPRLRERLDAIDAAMHACDDVDRLFGDGEAHPPIFHLLVNHLRGLDQDPAAATIGRQLAFRLKLLLGAGIAPELGACARCGAAGPLTAFSGADGGLLCSGCEHSGFRIDPALPDVMRAALGSSLAEAPLPAPFVARQFDRAVTDLALHHLGAKLRGLQIDG
ncbi:MAG: DNA repair protein RecO [Solirubrobacteraceae bacterium]|nr:DNA repair protein RecO [Solirubrobacteraceae bacterium]